MSTSDIGAPKAPATPRRPVSDSYHGITVDDDYRWLDNLDDPEVRAWSDAQNGYSRTLLAGLATLGPVAERMRALYTAASADYEHLSACGGLLFAIKHQPPQAQPLLVTLASADDPASERVVLDPNRLDPSGATAIDFYQPSRDGRLVAVSLSQNGSEEGTLHFYEVATGRELGDLIPRVTYPTAGGSVAWDADGAGVFYTRYPQGDERPPADYNFYQQVYYHRLGAPTAADTYVIGADFPRIAEIELHSSGDGRYLLATVANGDGGAYAHYLRGPDGAWSQVARDEDGVTRAAFGPDDGLYLLSHHEAPRGQILRVPLAAPTLAGARTIVPQRDTTIASFAPAATRLYVVELDGGPSQVRAYDLAGREEGLLPIPPASAVKELEPVQGDEVLIRIVGYTRPPAWFRFDPAEEELAPTALARATPADFSNVAVERVYATSRDGTNVPISILRRKDMAPNGDSPTILYGYGGFGISLAPNFNPSVSVWLEHGGVFAFANLRGGGEYGEEWHRAGSLTNKQNVFDDFIACAEHLIAAGYTRPRRLGIMGRSNGGLLVAAALTQRPELFRAAAPLVGIYDMLRLELDPNGAFNVTEFGSVSDPAQFAALYAYSPYHRVADGVAYPAVLLMTGEHDGRANPAHSRKLAARLQAATSSGLPVLLRTSASSGHGMGSSLAEHIAEQADLYAFLLDQLTSDE